MAVIKTISPNFLRSVLADNFDVGLLVSDTDRRKELANIELEEIDVLINRLNDVKGYVKDAQEERRREAMEALKTVLSETGLFNSVEELLAVVTGGDLVDELVKAKKSHERKSSSSNNKSFTVVIGQKSYSVVNKQIPAGLRDSEAYQTLIKSRPEMESVDNLLREYSTDYQEAYPFNAVWNGKEFHMNTRGKPNGTAMKYFEEFKKKDKSGKIERDLLQAFKTKVAEDFTSKK